MNDLLIANTHQYAPSKYHLRRGDNKCKQQSSGLLFSTWFGQGAWLNHTVDEATMTNLRKRVGDGDSSDHYFFVARDITHNERNNKPWSWIDWTNEATILTSDMHRGYVVPDGWDEVHFNRGATITVNTDAPRLCLLTFRKTLDEKLKLMASK